MLSEREMHKTALKKLGGMSQRNGGSYMKNDKQNTDIFIDDNETEQDLLTALAKMTKEEIREINKKYD